MKKIYLMALTAAFAMSVNAQTTIKIKNPGFRGENKNAAAKTGNPGQVGSPNQVTCVVTCNTQYTAGVSQNLNFSYTATNADLEFVDFFELTFPAGITPTGSSDATFPTSNSTGGAEALNAAAGQVISWGVNNDDQYGGIITTTAGVTFNVNVTVGVVTGNQTATYLASGDGFGAAPGDATGSVIIYPAGAVVVNMQTKLMGVVTNTTTFTQALAHNCSMGMAVIASQIHNLGSNTESNIPVNYSVNGVASVITTYTGSIAPGDSALVIFPIPYNFAPQNIYNIKAWTAALGDVAKGNDTVAIAISNSLPIALTNTANAQTSGVETAYEVGSVNLDWIGTGTTFGLSQANFHSGLQAYFLTLPGSGVPAGTYESYVNLPCVDVMSGEAYRVSYWRKCTATTGTVTANGQTGIFSGLTQDAAGMTDVVKAYTAMVPTLLSGVNGWQKDSADYVATATETRYFAIAGKGVINGASDQMSVRLDDIKIARVISTGVKTIAANDAISIFPNPTSGILNINAVEANSSVEVINVIGEKVYTSSLVKGNNVVDLSGLANGAYFVKLNSNNTITTKKVVLSK